jgi:hypothetical protein
LEDEDEDFCNSSSLLLLVLLLLLIVVVVFILGSFRLRGLAGVVSSRRCDNIIKKSLRLLRQCSYNSIVVVIVVVLVW